MAQKKRTFSIKQMMMIAAYFALVVVAFQNHWPRPEKWFSFWYPPEGLVSGLLFFGRLDPLFRCLSFLVIPWLICDAAQRTKRLVFDASSRPFRQRFGLTFAKSVLTKAIGLACLMYWLIEPHVDFEDIWGNWTDNQILRVIQQLTFVIPLFGLLCLATPIVRLRPAIANPTDAESRKTRNLLLLNRAGYAICIPLIAILAFIVLLGQSIVSALVAIAIHSIEIAMPTGFSSTTKVTEYQPGMFSISNFTDLCSPLALCSCLSLLSLIMCFCFSRSSRRRTQLISFTGWAIITIVLVTYLSGTLETFLATQEHWFDLLNNYRGGSSLALGLTAALGMIAVLLFHNSANGTWERIGPDQLQLESLLSPWWLVLLAVSLLPVMILEIPAALLIACGLLCLDLRRTQTLMSEGTEVEVFRTAFSPISLLLSWVTYSLSVILAAVTFGLLGIAFFASPTWPNFVEAPLSFLNNTVDSVGIYCWVMLVGCCIWLVVRQTIRWRRNRKQSASLKAQ